MNRFKKLNKEDYYKLFDDLITDPIKISITVFVISALLIICTTLFYGYYSDKFRENLLVEAHGTLLDILLLGVFVVWLQQKGEKRKDNKRYVDEIDDLRGWDNEMAARKIRGNIRRLNNNGVYSINLSNCCLKNMDLSGAVLSSSDFWSADLSNADLRNCILSNCNFDDTKMNGVCLRGATLIKSVFRRVNVDDVDFRDANLEKAQFIAASMVGADCDSAQFISALIQDSDLRDGNFWNASFEGADLGGTNLEGAHLKDANLLHVTGLEITQLVNCSLWMARLDNHLFSAIQEKSPELLLEPEGDGW